MSRRGDIWYVDLDPTRGNEANKTRPAVIVGNQAAVTAAFSSGRGVVTVVPITKNTATVRPFQVLLPADTTGLPYDSTAQAEQVRSVDVTRFADLAGGVPPDLMLAVDDALRLHLAL